MTPTSLRLALHGIFNTHGHQLATGVIFNESSRRFTTINAWVTVVPDTAKPVRGRKRNLARKVAVALAHEWYRAWKDMKQGQADSAVAALLGYQDERAVRRVRSEVKKELSSPHYLLTVRTHHDTDEGAVILLEKSVTTQTPVKDKTLTVSGPGWVWTHGKAEAVYNQWHINGESENSEWISQLLQLWDGGQE